MTPSDQRYEPSAQEPLFILAMDQRSSFAKLFGLEENADEAGLAKMRDAKLTIYEGLHKAAASGLEVGRAGVLVDEHLGSEVARRAKADGLVLAMPIEKSGTQLVRARVRQATTPSTWPPTIPTSSRSWFATTLPTRPTDRTAQIERLAEVSAWAAKTGRRWLFELLVPPTREQLAQSEDQFHFDREARPGLTAETIGVLQDGGVHPTVWKLEGYETTEGAEEVLRAVAAETTLPPNASSSDATRRWSRSSTGSSVAAPLPGYRRIRRRPQHLEAALQDLLAGRIDRDDAVATIAESVQDIGRRLLCGSSPRVRERRQHGALYMAAPAADAGS